MNSRTAATLAAAVGLTLGGGAMLIEPASAAPVTTDDTGTTDDTTADTTTNTTGTSGATDTADGVTDDTTSTASSERTSRVREVLQPLVDDGTITEEQADAVADTLTSELGGRWSDATGDQFRLALSFEDVGDLLDLEPSTVRAALAGGQSLVDLAEGRGVDEQELIEGLVAAATAQLDAAVEDGDLTQEEADERSAQLEDRITALVNRSSTVDGQHRDGASGMPGLGSSGGPGGGSMGGRGNGSMNGPGNGNRRGTGSGAPTAPGGTNSDGATGADEAPATTEAATA